MNMTAKPESIKSPILRYHGGKWRIAPWVISHFPPHKVYVEPFGGSAAVLIQKERAITEIYNDLDAELFNLFKVMRDEAQARELYYLLKWTPHSRKEYDAAFETSDDPVEQARRSLVKVWFGMHTKGLKEKSGFDTRVNNDGYCGRVNSFVKISDLLELYRERLTGVILECVDALKLLDRHDSINTLTYLDPPYVPDTRSGKLYRYEMTNDDHRALAEKNRKSKGMIIISGYPSDLYDQELYSDWVRVDRKAHTDGGHERIEALWLNPQAWAALEATKAQGVLI